MIMFLLALSQECGLFQLFILQGLIFLEAAKREGPAAFEVNFSCLNWFLNLFCLLKESKIYVYALVMIFLPLIF